MYTLSLTTQECTNDCEKKKKTHLSKESNNLPLTCLEKINNHTEHNKSNPDD